MACRDPHTSGLSTPPHNRRRYALLRCAVRQFLLPPLGIYHNRRSAIVMIWLRCAVSFRCHDRLAVYRLRDASVTLCCKAVPPSPSGYLSQSALRYCDGWHSYFSKVSKGDSSLLAIILLRCAVSLRRRDWLFPTHPRKHTRYLPSGSARRSHLPRECWLTKAHTPRAVPHHADKVLPFSCRVRCGSAGTHSRHGVSVAVSKHCMTWRDGCAAATSTVAASFLNIFLPPAGALSPQRYLRCGYSTPPQTQCAPLRARDASGDSTRQGQQVSSRLFGAPPV